MSLSVLCRDPLESGSERCWELRSKYLRIKVHSLVLSMLVINSNNVLCGLNKYLLDTYMAVYVYNKPINHGQHVGWSINTIKRQGVIKILGLNTG